MLEFLRLDWSPAEVLRRCCESLEQSICSGLCLQSCDSDPLSTCGGCTPAFQCSNSTELLLNHLADHPHVLFHFLFHFGTRSLPHPSSPEFQSSHSWDPTASSAAPAPGVLAEPTPFPFTSIFWSFFFPSPSLQLRVQLLWKLQKAAAFHQL